MSLLLKPIISTKRSLLRHTIISFLLLISFIAFHNRHSNLPRDKSNPTSFFHPAPSPHFSKTIVVASQLNDDTTWLQKRLPQWPVAQYIVDSPCSKFQVPINKGREAMVYLTYIIDHYDQLPEIIVFIHSLQYQWHNDDPNHDGATVLSLLRLPYVQEEGYVNLRCVWELGCPVELYPNSLVTDEILDTDKDYDRFVTQKIFRDAYLQLFYDDAERDSEGFDVELEVPDAVGVSCCAQFAVSRDRVLARPKSDYERFRTWLIDAPFDDAISGRVFEYSWHMIFGKPPVFCPDAQTCYCNVFGLCDLEYCTEDACEGRYTMPEFTDVPDDWRQLPEYDVVG